MTPQAVRGTVAPDAKRLRRSVLGLLLACACAPSEEPEAVPEEAPAEAPAQEPETQDTTRAIPIAYVEGEFPHAAHAGVACSVCHGAMPGHATHGQTECVECHVPPAASADSRPTPAECSACHHAGDRRQACARCHTAPPAPLAVAATFTVADRPAGVERPLSFDHARHDAIPCRTCHTGGVTLAVERTCASCHDDHHRPAADCATCHAAFPLGTHEGTAHRGCDGAGCHRASPALAAPGPRNVCLVCHRAQVDHEPGGECRECHFLTGAGP